MAIPSSLAKRSAARTLYAGWRSTVTLARWQLRLSWHLLFLMGLGMTVAVILACTIPLYAQATQESGLRSTFVASAPDSYITFQGDVRGGFKPNDLVNGLNTLTQAVHNDLGGQFTASQPSLTVTAADFQGPANDTASSQGFNGPILIGQDMAQLAERVRIVQGRVPDEHAQTAQVAVSEETARALHLQVGSLLVAMFPYNVPTERINITKTLPLPLQVAAIVQTKVQGDPLWQGNALASVHQHPEPQAEFDKHGQDFKILLPNSALINVISRLPVDERGDLHSGFIRDLQWSARVNEARLDLHQIDAATSAADRFFDDVYTDPSLSQLLSGSPHLGRMAQDALQQYQDHIAVAQLPTSILTVLIIGLLLFFVSLLAGLLVDWQTRAMVVLRSRGASQPQLYSALFLQALMLALLTVILGVPLAYVLLRWMVHVTLGANGTGVLQMVIGQPWQALSEVRWQLLGTVVISVLAVGLALLRVIQLDVLAWRREQGRPSRPPFWQRFYLDVLLMILALAGYGLALFLLNVGLTAKARALFQAPLILAASLLLLLAGVLLFLRLFPLLLRGLLRLGTRGRGLTSVIGVGMMARAPQQALRMILLLTFALAFAVFSLLFSASQTRHQRDVASYQVGSDFSGALSAGLAGQQSLLQLQRSYRELPGVSAATVGTVMQLQASPDDASEAINVKLLAIDPSTFIDATTWNGQDRATLQAQLNRLGRTEQNGLPALVDRVTMNTFHLQIHQLWTISDAKLHTYSLRIVGEVPPVPSVNDNAGSGIGQGGVLVDNAFWSARVKKAVADDTQVGISSDVGDVSAAPNYVWLRTGDNPTELTRLRASLQQGTLALAPLYDRRALYESLSHDPLYLSFVGVLALGAVAPILLALVGNLLSSWWNVRSRVTSFVVLRAIGSTVGQLAHVLLYEQGIIYFTALLLGLLFGGLLASLTLPSLVFTSVSALQGPISEGVNKDVFAIQNVPPLHMEVPPTLLLIIGGLVIVCIVALWLMVRTVTRPLLSQTLRLNED